MASNWVWRRDGTLQCGLGREETLDEARAALATVIGADNVLAGEKRTLPGPIITLCGAPTGQVNAFELTELGFWLLFHGIVGPIGFRPWLDVAPARLLAGSEGNYAAAAAAVPQGQAIRLADGSGSLDDLIGRPCRVYRVGDALTKDYIENRFNIGTVDGRIAEIWFG